MNKITLPLLLILLLAPLASQAAKPILNLRDVPVPIYADGSTPTLEEVRTAIVEACLARRWVPVLDGEGNVHASIVVRGKHFAEIEIPFSATSYSIIYKSSRGLDYNERRQRIHRNYNNWVVKLSGTIERQLRRASSVGNSDGRWPGKAPVIVVEKKDGDIYSQLLKLGDLRDRGILTEDEYETEKRKLLEKD